MKMRALAAVAVRVTLLFVITPSFSATETDVADLTRNHKLSDIGIGDGGDFKNEEKAVHGPNKESQEASDNRQLKTDISGLCPPITNVTYCGQSFQNVTVTLGQDLICNYTDPETPSPYAAIILTGNNTVLDCQGHSISQVTNSSSSAVDCKFTRNLKQECGLTYEYGIRVQNGATVKNCNVKKFYVGGSIKGGGTIEKSDFSLNFYGVNVYNTASKTESKVLQRYVSIFWLRICEFIFDLRASMREFVYTYLLTFYSLCSNFYNNAVGLTIFQMNKDGATVLLEGISSNDSDETNPLTSGIQLTGTGITLREVEASSNVRGVLIVAEPFNSTEITYEEQASLVYDITFDGQVYLNNNLKGLEIMNSGFPGPTKGTLHVNGDLKTDRNILYGVTMDPNTDFNIVLGKMGSSVGKSKKGRSGSITACKNGQYDIYNEGNGDFEGNGYTCDNTFTPNQKQLPVCKRCPECPLFD